MDRLDGFQLVKLTGGRKGSPCLIYKVNKLNAFPSRTVQEAEPERLGKQWGAFNMVFAAAVAVIRSALHIHPELK